MKRYNLSPEEIETLAKRDKLSYGVFFVDLLENREWQVFERPWSIDIYAALNPYEIEKNPIGKPRTEVIQKSTQCGMSTMAVVSLFHFADFWSTRQIYMLPREKDYQDFVSTRVDPMIRRSDRLRNLLGTPDSLRSKKFGNSYLFFMESTVEPRMMPADAVRIDELDLSDQKHVSVARNRMDESSWKLLSYFSTPTVPNYGINALLNASDKREWFVPCPKCNHLQIMDWDKNLRVLGPAAKPTRVFFGCQKCDAEINLPDIWKGFWVPEYPERDTIGFHVSQMMTKPAKELYRIYRDPMTKLYEFYRLNLGQPYELGIGSLTREDILANCFDEPYDFEIIRDGKSRYFMGVDQGNELQVLIGKTERGSERPKIVHKETVPFEQGFDRAGQLMRLFNIRLCVVDADPNRHSARDFQRSFLGKVLLADYANISTDWQTKDDPKLKVKTNVLIGRSEGFDKLMESIKDGEWQLPGELPGLPVDTEVLIDHITALKRDVETHRTASGEKEVAVWRELRATHFAHAWLYLKIAMEVIKGKRFRSRVIGKSNLKEQEVAEEVREELGVPSKETIIEITWLLAEIPLDQLEWFLNNEDDELCPPFPLFHKLAIARKRFEEDDIIYVIKQLIKDKKLILP